MTTLAERVPVDEISAQAKQAQPGRVLITLILGFFFMAGWIAGKLWFGAADCVVAFRVGYRAGRGLPAAEEKPPPG